MTDHPAAEIKTETSKLKREITLLPLFALIYFTVSGGAFGVEALFGLSGPILALILLAVTPLFFSIPNILLVREMTSMMPVEGGYYHWVKQAMGRFSGFMAGWMNWVVSWVDVAIYPVLATYYLSYLITPLREGLTVGSITLDAWLLQWIVSIILIWLISALNVRGARIAGLFTNWLGIGMIIPLVIMSAFGIYNWIHFGGPTNLPLLPQKGFNFPSFTTAISTGLFIVMWNYIGWELPTAAGDEIVNPKRTYPLAMALVLLAAVATYAIPTVAGLYGGAGENGKYLLWGQEEASEGQGIGPVMQDYGIDTAVLQSWGVDPASPTGWEFPQIAHAIGEKTSGQKDGPLAGFLGTIVMASAVLSMIGLFIGNGLGGTRIPFALAEDGMMPKWLVKVHPKYGTPWIAILFCGLIYSIFTLQAFSFLVVVDVFLNMLVLMMEFAALWVLRIKRPDIPRKAIPGGYWGLALATLGPTLFVAFAIYSQVATEGFKSIGLALAAMVVGAVVYGIMFVLVKPGVPDVNPFVLDQAEG